MAAAAAEEPDHSTMADFHNPHDDAWYTVRFLFVGGNEAEVAGHIPEGFGPALRVIYGDGPRDDWDEWYCAGQFDRVEEVENFKNRFRRASAKLVDEHCIRTRWVGNKVCARCRSGEGKGRYYDGVLVDVREHPHDDGKCDCEYKIEWGHGPKKGKRSTITAKDICVIPRDWEIVEVPEVLQFLEAAKTCAETKVDKEKKEQGPSG